MISELNNFSGVDRAHYTPQKKIHLNSYLEAGSNIRVHDWLQSDSKRRIYILFFYFISNDSSKQALRPEQFIHIWRVAFIAMFPTRHRLEP